MTGSTLRTERIAGREVRYVNLDELKRVGLIGGEEREALADVLARLDALEARVSRLERHAEGKTPRRLSR